jgi:hypothetical protein
MNNERIESDDYISKSEFQYSSNSLDLIMLSNHLSINDLPKLNQSHSKDSALDLSDENISLDKSKYYFIFFITTSLVTRLFLSSIILEFLSFYISIYH